MTTINVPSDFGYIVLVFVASFAMNMWLSIRVYAARFKYGVNYPALYSADNNIFNCIQRTHQNYIEYFPFFLGVLIFGGLAYPKISALAGAVYLAGRVVYTFGYSTGDPSKRFKGAFQLIGYFTLLGCTVKFALDLLQWI